MANDAGHMTGYGGDVTPVDAYRALEAEPEAVLIDVRTRAELAYVGHPDLSGLGKRLVAVEWQPVAGGYDPGFVDRLETLGLDHETPLYLICRSGSRSRFAAIAATERGFTSVFNVAHGFEGPVDAHGHRGTSAGWKAEGLPWRQT